MGEPKSPDTGIFNVDLARVELASKVARGQVVTESIHKDRLLSFLNAASKTGFKVEKIADEGEEFPCASIEPGEMQMLSKDGKFIRGVSNIKVDAKGYIAVSIERPEGEKDHTAFWKNLKNLEQKKT